ncbi:MAG: TIR domain-containing protein [Sideroxydans sp.]|nr:TIR domain-containing protein [Sideroxydans sp.]
MIVPLVRLVVGAAAAFGVYKLLTGKKKVFVSYYYDSDRHYKRLLMAWSANDKFELEFEDVSTDVSIRSDNEAYIKRVISDKIKQCDVFIVLVGKKSHRRDWINWEIAKAKEYGKKIVAIKGKRSHTSPEELLSAGAEWVYGFEEKKIREAIFS